MLRRANLPIPTQAKEISLTIIKLQQENHQSRATTKLVEIRPTHPVRKPRNNPVGRTKSKAKAKEATAHLEQENLARLRANLNMMVSDLTQSMS